MSLPREEQQLLALEAQRARARTYALYGVVACLLGFVGFALTLIASYAEACQVVDSPESATYAYGMLTRWPSTVSELNSDWNSARGRLFFAFMLATSAMLFASRMPFELDTLPFERSPASPPPPTTTSSATTPHPEPEPESTAVLTEQPWAAGATMGSPGDGYDAGSADPHVCCLADCGPRCDFPCHRVATSIVTATAPTIIQRSASHIMERLPAQLQERHDDEPRCCVVSLCADCEASLIYWRGNLAPLGILFVALCPTVNFWSTFLPGAGVVRAVHLTAAACLFAGGTITETLRIYYLWCASRRAGVRTGHPDALYGSCRRFVLPDPRQSEGVGPVRPWLIGCLLVGIVGAALSLHEDMSFAGLPMRVARGDVALSPTATAYCPQPDFRYLDVRTIDECNKATERLRQPWVPPHGDLHEEMWTRPPLPTPTKHHGKRTRRQAAAAFMFRSQGMNVSESGSGCLVATSSRQLDESAGLAGLLSINGDHEEAWKKLETLKRYNDTSLQAAGYNRVGLPPNTRCNLLNFDEGAERCLPYARGDRVEFRARCNNLPPNQNPCDSDDQCLPGGVSGSTVDAANSTCCQRANITDRINCCMQSCPDESMPYTYDDSVMLRVELDLAVYTCPSAIILPSYQAVCVCDPADDHKHFCEWTAAEPAEPRLRLFMQESALAVLLLMNYFAISLEHAIRNPTVVQRSCRSWLLHLAVAAMPIAIVSMSFACKAYVREHKLGNDGNSPADWIPGWEYDVIHPGFKYFTAQLRVYWVSGAAIALMLGRAMAQRRPWLLVTYVLLVLIFCVWFAFKLAEIVTRGGVLFKWISEDCTLVCIVVFVWFWRARDLSIQRLCVGSCTCWVVGWILAYFVVTSAAAGDRTALAIWFDVLGNALVQLFGVTMLMYTSSCCVPHKHPSAEGDPQWPSAPVTARSATGRFSGVGRAQPLRLLRGACRR
eukprot:COSAG01_NODE_115_length_25561_cov_103.183450_9_plen_948_part_00